MMPVFQTRTRVASTSGRDDRPNVILGRSIKNMDDVESRHFLRYWETFCKFAQFLVDEFSIEKLFALTEMMVFKDHFELVLFLPRNRNEMAAKGGQNDGMANGSPFKILEIYLDDEKEIDENESACIRVLIAKYVLEGTSLQLPQTFFAIKVSPYL